MASAQKSNSDDMQMVKWVKNSGVSPFWAGLLNQNFWGDSEQAGFGESQVAYNSCAKGQSSR